ncbi:GNAT family N-acetyltransferase [Singulisphaera sp. PoT]|uniref:GNAT family N-acetyltransferase n=1 Tax=Singulisphaera sp. PoT TaxID=3411797 RepID=UPI003BF4E4CA
MDSPTPDRSSFELVEVASPADLEDARTLFRAYASEFADWLAETLRYQSFDAEVAGLPGRYAPPLGGFLLARDGGIPAGCVALRALGVDTCEMKRLYVAPAYRGQDLGMRLVEAVIDLARRLGHRRIVLDTLPEMRGAISLYRSLGFIEIPAYWDNPIERSLFFEKILIDEASA